MDALEAITQRVSIAQLTGPDVSDEQKTILAQAAMRAPDHAWMRPSRYLTIEGDARARLGQIFYEAQSAGKQLPDEKRQKMH